MTLNVMTWNLFGKPENWRNAISLMKHHKIGVAMLQECSCVQVSGEGHNSLQTNGASGYESVELNRLQIEEKTPLGLLWHGETDEFIYLVSRWIPNYRKSSRDNDETGRYKQTDERRPNAYQSVGKATALLIQRNLVDGWTPSKDNVTLLWERWAYRPMIGAYINGIWYLSYHAPSGVSDNIGRWNLNQQLGCFLDRPLSAQEKLTPNPQAGPQRRFIAGGDFNQIPQVYRKFHRGPAGLVSGDDHDHDSASETEIDEEDSNKDNWHSVIFPFTNRSFIESQRRIHILRSKELTHIPQNPNHNSAELDYFITNAPRGAIPSAKDTFKLCVGNKMDSDHKPILLLDSASENTFSIEKQIELRLDVEQDDLNVAKVSRGWRSDDAQLKLWHRAPPDEMEISEDDDAEDDDDQDNGNDHSNNEPDGSGGPNQKRGRDDEDRDDDNGPDSPQTNNKHIKVDHNTQQIPPSTSLSSAQPAPDMNQRSDRSGEKSGKPTHSEASPRGVIRERDAAQVDEGIGSVPAPQKQRRRQLALTGIQTVGPEYLPDGIRLTQGFSSLSIPVQFPEDSYVSEDGFLVLPNGAVLSIRKYGPSFFAK